MENEVPSDLARWTRRKFDKLESSPNNRSNCVCCGEKIVKESERVVIHAKFSTLVGRKFGDRYYHGGCIMTYKTQISSEPAAKATKKAKVTENKTKAATAANTPTSQQHKLRPQQRNRLGQELRLLRKYFAIAQGVERSAEYKIFPNKSIEDLILKLPSNNAELMQCWGIKEKRIIQYGSAILKVVWPYLSHNTNHQQRQQHQTQQQRQQPAPVQPLQQQIVTPTSLDEVRNLSVKELKKLALHFAIDVTAREKIDLQNDVWQAINNNPTTAQESEARGDMTPHPILRRTFR